MRKTANYELNQWDPGDRILREEFNGDNARIDAALAGMPYVKLVDVTTDVAANQVDIDVSKIDFGSFAKIELCIESWNCGYLSLRVNGLIVYTQQQTSGSASGFESTTNALAGFMLENGTPAAILLFNTPLPEAYIHCVSFQAASSSYTGYHRVSTCKWKELHTLNVVATGAGMTIPTGTRILLYGVRK